MKVIVCGGGIAGLAAAKQISASGHEVVLLERAHDLRAQGYIIDLHGPGYDAVEAMGLLSAVRAVAYRFDGASLVDARGRRRAGLSYAAAAKANRGRIVSVMRPDLEQVLHQGLRGEVDLRMGSTVVDVRNLVDRVAVTLDDGSEVDGDLLVGADGIHSTVRQREFGSDAQFLHYLGLRAAAFVIDAPEVAATLGGRCLLSDTADREMGFFTLHDGRVAAFAVHRAPEPDISTDRRAALRDTYRGMGWLIPEALERCPPAKEIYYDQVAQIEMPHWSKDRVTLIGDACAAVSLMAGHGAGLGIAGAYVLAEKLRTAGSIEQAQIEYESLVRPIAEQIQRRGRGAVRWLVPESALQLWLRRAALKLLRMPIVDRYMATAMAGPAIPLVSDIVAQQHDSVAGPGTG